MVQKSTAEIFDRSYVITEGMVWFPVFRQYNYDVSIPLHVFYVKISKAERY